MLSAEQRQFIVGLYEDGRHTQARIAELLGIHQGSVSRTLAQARRRDPAIRKRWSGRASGKRRPKKSRIVLAVSQLGSPKAPLDLDKL
jgi:transposase-like protein